MVPSTSTTRRGVVATVVLYLERFDDAASALASGDFQSAVEEVDIDVYRVVGGDQGIFDLDGDVATPRNPDVLRTVGITNLDALDRG